jgi:hypothetical protein
VAAADLDGDGDQDLACANGDLGTLTVFFQSTEGFDPKPLVLGGFGTALPVRVVAADLDGDGDQDLVTSNYPPDASETLSVFFQTSSGSFERVPELLHHPGGLFGRFLEAADLDGDGHQDLLSVGSPIGGVSACGRSSRFAREIHPTRHRGPRHVRDHADLDGDADADVRPLRQHGMRVFFGGR